MDTTEQNSVTRITTGACNLQILANKRGVERINHDQIEGQWQELAGQVKQHWGALTNGEATRAEGNIDEFTPLFNKNTATQHKPLRRN